MKLLRKFFMRMAREVFSRFESHDPRVLIELAFVQHLLGDSKGGAQTLEGLRGKFPIHFPLGRILVESASKDDMDQWNRALKELRECPDQNSPAISYYLGRALLGLIRAEKETEVEALFSRYADAGFPLGDREEVEKYLNSRDPEKQIRVLLLKARNKEKEQSLDGAIEALEQAVSLGSKKAMEELMRVAALLEQWEKVMATGMSLIKSGKGSESFEENFVNHIIEAHRQEYPLAIVKDILEKSEKVEAKKELLSRIAAYQKFLDKNPIPTINEISAQ